VTQPDSRYIHVPGVARVFDRRLLLLVNMVPLAMALMQISSVNVGLPSISASLRAESSDLQWVLSGYALAFGITLVPAGRIGDLFGRGSVFIAGLAVFAVASLACGLADTPLVLNVARVFQGLGAGLQGPQTTGMIQQYFTGQSRAQAYSLNGLVVAASVAVGPVMTGSLIHWLGAGLGWRVPFLINFPLGLAGCALALRWFPFESERARRRAKREKAAGGVTAGGVKDRGPGPKLDLDPVGAVLLTGAVVSVMLPFMLGEDAPPARFWILAGVALFGGAWLKWEHSYKRRGREPMVDLSLLKLRSFAHQTAVSTIDFLGITSVFVVIAMYLQQGLGWDPLPASLIGLPNAALSMLGAIWTGRHILAQRNKLIVGALTPILLGLLASMGVVYLVWNGHASAWWLLLTFGVYGFGQGMFGAANQTLSMLEVPVAMAGTAGGVKSMAERCSTAVGNAVMTGLLFAVLPALGWSGAVVTTYAAIAVVITCALALATVFLVRIERRAA
jgi:MFS family permease